MGIKPTAPGINSEHSGTQAGVILGTAAYTSPEQAHDDQSAERLPGHAVSAVVAVAGVVRLEVVAAVDRSAGA